MGRHVVMMDMTKVGNINGVARCIMTLSEGLSRNHSICVTWIRFVHGCQSCQNNEINTRLRIVQIPLPNDISSFLANGKIREKYWAEAYNRLLPALKDSTILHVHTLNLMEFALLVKKHTNIKIVTHLHCIPWKNLYNNRPEHFNLLYRKYYINRDYNNWKEYILHEYEWNSYIKSDVIICVTECARQFIHNVCPFKKSNVEVVYNGIRNIGYKHNYEINRYDIKCLFVGNASRSKGLYYVLKALKVVSMYYLVRLIIVGNYSEDIREYIRLQHPFVEVEFVGTISMIKLKNLYWDSDIGIISSLQEQCSYAAIEMMMFGIPIISTNVDGLGEIFKNNETALIVNTSFRPIYGISVNTLEMIESIIALIENKHLRQKLGHNAYKMYKVHYTQQQMVKRVKTIYDKISSTINI